MPDKSILIDESNINDKIYIIRGQKVMLDFDLAEIYGYTNSAFGQQVKNNIDRFDEDFYFQLTSEEFLNLKSKNLISSYGDKHNLKSKNLISSWGGARKIPHAFTEQGIYMLMTVLKGDLAVKQSKALIRTFKKMKDYILTQNQNLVNQSSFLQLSERVDRQGEDIKNLFAGQSEIRAIINSFSDSEHYEKLLMDGKYVDADLVYSGIYNSAKKSIYIIDNYINLKTLVLLKDIRTRVECFIFSNNKGSRLHNTELKDFQKQYPDVKITIKEQNQPIHDRFIIIDYKTEDEKIYHCGSSSKDSGRKHSMISQVSRNKNLEQIIEKLLKS